MKRIFTLFAIALMATAAMAQTSPLYTVSTKITADAAWGEEYAPYFAFQGTAVDVEVYDEDYVIIKNWAGAEGCDLKVEYDPNIDVDADECMGNIFAMTTIINGEEQEPLKSYEKEVVDEDGNTYIVTYIDIATGRSDYPVCSTSLNEDGTLYWSFVEVDKENKTGYVELSAYFMTADYDTENLAGSVYFVEWPEASEAAFYGTFDGETIDDEESIADLRADGSFPVITEGIKVDAYSNYIYVHSLAGVEGYDMKVEFDDEENITSITAYRPNGDDIEAKTYTSGYGKIYTGLNDANYKYIQPYLAPGYAYANCTERGGYIYIPAYDAQSSKYILYYLIWGEGDEDPVMGDVNGDGDVDVTDLNLIIDVICGETVEGETDVDGDGTTDVTDLNKVIDIICGE